MAIPVLARLNLQLRDKLVLKWYVKSAWSTGQFENSHDFTCFPLASSQFQPGGQRGSPELVREEGTRIVLGTWKYAPEEP